MKEPEMARTAAKGTRERILDVAGELFYAHGIRAVGMSQIIEAAGCGKNLLYTHFASKDELVSAYLSVQDELLEKQALVVVAGAGPDPADQLVALTEDVALCVARQGFRGCAMRLFMAEFPDARGPSAEIAHRYFQHFRDRLEELARKTGAARPQEVADRIWLVHDGLYATAARPWVRSSPEVAVQMVRDILLLA
jgi:AcrR family transcriptional regulator